MKKTKTPEINAGIWLDKENAYVVKIEGEAEPELIKIKSGVESRIRVPGEGKVSARFGNSFIDDQEKKQRRQRNQLKHFFKEIAGCLHDVEYLWFLGPGNAKEGLKNLLEKDSEVRAKIIAVDNAEKLNQKKIVRMVGDYFSSDVFRLYKRNIRRLGKGRKPLVQ